MTGRTVRMTALLLVLGGAMAAIGALMTGTAAYVTAAVVLFVLILLLAPFAFGSLRVRRKEERLPHPVFIR